MAQNKQFVILYAAFDDSSVKILMKIVFNTASNSTKNAGLSHFGYLQRLGQTMAGPLIAHYHELYMTNDIFYFSQTYFAFLI